MIVLEFLLCFVCGCSSTLKPTVLNSTGYFETDTVLYANSIDRIEPFKNQYTSLLYVKTDENNKRFNTFHLETFKNMNIFKEVRDKGEMENLVFEKGLANRVSNVSDKIGLHNLQKEIGPFLVVEPHTEWEGGYNYIASLKVFDPQSGKDVLVIKNKAFNWAGLDKPLFFPLFNAFLDWARGEKIAIKPTPN
jgi:hypothetical protein